MLPALQRRSVPLGQFDRDTLWTFQEHQTPTVKIEHLVASAKASGFDADEKAVKVVAGKANVVEADATQVGESGIIGRFGLQIMQELDFQARCATGQNKRHMIGADPGDAHVVGKHQSLNRHFLVLLESQKCEKGLCTGKTVDGDGDMVKWQIIVNS